MLSVCGIMSKRETPLSPSEMIAISCLKPLASVLFVADWACCATYAKFFKDEQAAVLEPEAAGSLAVSDNIAINQRPI